MDVVSIFPFFFFSVRSVFVRQGYNADVSMWPQGSVPKVLREDDPGGSHTEVSTLALRGLPLTDSQAQTVRCQFTHQESWKRPTERTIVVIQATSECIGPAAWRKKCRETAVSYNAPSAAAGT